MPNYTINKGTLAENMATAAIEYPFCTGREYGRKSGRITSGKIAERHRG